jgi:hypothetical protein
MEREANERQPERAAVEEHHAAQDGEAGAGRSYPEAGAGRSDPEAGAGRSDSDDFATPVTPFAPIAPFGDAKPWAGSTLAGPDDPATGDADATTGGGGAGGSQAAKESPEAIRQQGQD